MALIKSISGIRGTIGGKQGENLTPIDVITFTAAFCTLLSEKGLDKKKQIVIGRDARTTGESIASLAANTIINLGFDCLDIGLATTPTVEIAVAESNSAGGIVITASHNNENWNALKLLNQKGEFISKTDGIKLLEIAESNEFEYVGHSQIGGVVQDDSYILKHIEKILQLPQIDRKAIRKAKFNVAVDGINSVGGSAVPLLLEALGVKKIEKLNCEPTGIFSHNPEPLPENVVDICRLVEEKKCHVGFVVDPDVDRLAIIDENGKMIGEEYTLVAVADYILKEHPGNTVSNLSSTRALRDVTEKYGGEYFASAVGEVNVVDKMKEVGAVIGGEGNGGIILPELHYGRDALVGIALILSYLAKSKLKVSEIRNKLPNYYISKNKIELSSDIDLEQILKATREKYEDEADSILTIDGVKIEYKEEWIHLRKSNTEPIIRIYSESTTLEKAEELAQKIIIEINNINS